MSATERQNVFVHDTAACDECHLTDFRKLIQSAHTADENTVFDFTVSTQMGVICHDNVVTKLAVMTHVRVRHEITVVTDFSFFVSLASCKIDGSEFTEDVIASDNQACWFTFIRDILWSTTDNSTWAEVIVRADIQNTVARTQSDVALNISALANFYFTLNQTVRTDFNIVGQFNFWRDYA
ncbi:hypothetical protein D3C72_1432110 [compost metagenome]